MRLEEKQQIKDRIGRFNPRTPGGMRLLEGVMMVYYFEFQSTHSGGNATIQLPGA